MKKSGFSASYSAAIEACASTGAVLAPPVMGATAFVMAQFLNTSYADVALAATIPSMLYYVGLFTQVDSYAARHKLKGIPRAELPRFWDTFKEGWYYLFVIVLLDRDAACTSSARATRRSDVGPALPRSGLSIARLILLDGHASWGMCLLALNEFFPGKNWGGARSASN